MVVSKRSGVSLLFILLLYREILVSSASITISPKESVIPLNGSVSITCNSTIYTTRCQFLVRDDGKSLEYQIIEPTETQTVDSAQESDIKYHSKFDHAICNLNLRYMKSGRYLVGCRMLTKYTGWRYNYMALRVLDQKVTVLTWFPIETVTTDGSYLHRLRDYKVGLLCRLHQETQITRCSFALPGQEDWMNLVRLDGNPQHAIEYYGGGFRAGECGYTVTSVNENYNGMFWCELGYGSQYAVEAVPFIVAKEPTEVLLDNGGKSTYKVGDELTVTCIVKGSRPAPNITWYIDGQMHRNNSVDDGPDNDWRWPWSDIDITQKLSINISHNHKISCVVENNFLTFTKITDILVVIEDGNNPYTSTTQVPSTISTVPIKDDKSDSNTGLADPDNEKLNVWKIIGIVCLLVIILIAVALVVRYIKKRGAFKVSVPDLLQSALVDNDLYGDETLACQALPQNKVQPSSSGLGQSESMTSTSRRNAPQEPEAEYTEPFNEYEDISNMRPFASAKRSETSVTDRPSPNQKEVSATVEHEYDYADPSLFPPFRKKPEDTPDDLYSDPWDDYKEPVPTGKQEEKKKREEVSATVEHEYDYADPTLFPPFQKKTTETPNDIYSVPGKKKENVIAEKQGEKREEVSATVEHKYDYADPTLFPPFRKKTTETPEDLYSVPWDNKESVPTGKQEEKRKREEVSATVEHEYDYADPTLFPPFQKKTTGTPEDLYSVPWDDKETVPTGKQGVDVATDEEAEDRCPTANEYEYVTARGDKEVANRV